MPSRAENVGGVALSKEEKSVLCSPRLQKTRSCGVEEKAQGPLQGTGNRKAVCENSHQELKHPARRAENCLLRRVLAVFWILGAPNPIRFQVPDYFDIFPPKLDLKPDPLASAHQRGAVVIITPDNLNSFPLAQVAYPSS
ncbi:hypothetical protein E5288_WYG004328 [Bos mutus]|uniref:Uncharacterized protein n=1 Tax=Bos mutus TaxID=72004 RepID=A0A6B0RXH9_9CETA|nr:hypothetical protein [Bos mutus]